MIGGNTLLAAANNGEASGGHTVHQIHNGSTGGGVSNGNPFAIMPQTATILPNQSQCHINNGNGTGFTINNNNNLFVHYNLLNTVAAAAGVGNYVCEGQMIKHPGGGGSSVHATSAINGGGFGSGGGGCGLATSATATPTAAPAAATMTPATTSATTVGIGGGGGSLLMYDCSSSVSCGGAAVAAAPIAAAAAIASTSAATAKAMTATAQTTAAVAGSTAATISTAKIPYSAGGGGLSTSFSSSPICSLATSFYPCNKVLLL